MTLPPADDSLPDLAPDLAAPLRQRLAALASPTAPRPGPLAVSADALRHWCEAFEDRHPPYLDPDCARRLGHPNCIAPLGAVLSTFVLPPTWPLPAGDDPPLRHLHHDVKAILGFPAAVVTSVAVDQPAHLVIGDRVAIRQRLLTVSAPTNTALGTGRFWTIERRYLAPDGTVAARETMTSLGFDPATRTTGRSRTAPAAAASDGPALPELHMSITPVRAALVASATRDFNPLHLDSGLARSAGAAAAFMSREFHLGIACRLLTDWGGDDARVRHLELALQRPLCIGDDMTARGHITRIVTENQRDIVDVALAIHAPHGVVSAGHGIVERPRPPS